MSGVLRFVQLVLGFATPLVGLRLARPLFEQKGLLASDGKAEPTIAGTAILGGIHIATWIAIQFLLLLIGGGLYIALFGMPSLAFGQGGQKPPEITAEGMLMMFHFTVVMTITYFTFVIGFSDWLFLDSFPNIKSEYEGLQAGITAQIAFIRSVYWLLGTLVVLGLSLLPLSALVVALPAVSPNEAVLSPSVSPARFWWHRLGRRISAVVAGIIVLLTLLAVSVQFISMLPLPKDGRLAAVAKKVLGIAVYRVENPKAVFSDYRPGVEKNVRPPTFTLAGDLTKEKKEQLGLTDEMARYLSEPLYERLPTVLVEHWPFIVLSIYGFDLLLLIAIGKVPVAYNIRNIVVRWRISALTALAFTVVVALVIVLLAFVNGMYELNEGTGVPGNVIVLSDGSTDEVFSNLGYGDVDNIPTVTVTEDADGFPLPEPIKVKQSTGADGKPAYLMSKEIFYTVNQKVPVPEGAAPRRRFLQVRAMIDSKVSSEVHNVPLAKGKWFDPSGVTQKAGPDGRQRTYIQAVLGDGVAAILGEDYGKARLEIGDTFAIGETDWLVVGIMQSEGKTFGSEIWAQNSTLITKPFGKDKYTTLVLRTTPETNEAAKAMAYHLQYRYDQQKLKTFSEQDYFKELTKTNEDFLTQIIILAVVMAIGGVFGVMNTMFASIAARIKEVGVLRILGFKRWQILISFMLESLAIAFVGGLVGCLFGCFANGFEATSSLSGQGGGGKRVLLKLTVDYQTVAAGMLFTLIMGRLGGLVPALSAMRMKILDTLR